jgi:hypothetical protein
MSRASFGQNILGSIVRAGKNIIFPGASNDLVFKGMFPVIEHYGADGKLKGRYRMPNGITNVGKDHALDIVFHAGTQVTTWYIGLIDNSGYTAVAAADTMGSHAGWNEFTTYSESVRQEWTEGAPSSQSITNGTPATFSINGSGTVKGVFITSVSTKSGTTGTLWSTALFASNISVINGDSLKITYTVNAG